MPEIIIYDASGRVRPMSWARAKYGPFIIYPAAAGDGPAWRLTALREKNDATFIATAKQQDGGGAPGKRICFYWPDAPDLTTAGPVGAPFAGITPARAVTGYTDAMGNVGFAMGPGANFLPDKTRGPHAAWMHGLNTRSDVLLGIGMIPDDHLHLDAEWTLTDEQPETPTITDALRALAAALRALSASLTGLADVVEVIADE